MKSGIPITDLDGVQSTQIRYILNGEQCPSYPAIIPGASNLYVHVHAYNTVEVGMYTVELADGIHDQLGKLS